MQRVSYSSAIGNLMYAMVCSRPDLAHVVSMISRFMSDPRKQHWEVLKWVLRYLKGSQNVGLMYNGKASSCSKVEGFVDLYYAGSLDTRKTLKRICVYHIWRSYQLESKSLICSGIVNH